MLMPWRALCGSVITAVLAAGLVISGPAQPAAAGGQRGAAFVWNYDAAPPLWTWYTLQGLYQYNSTSPGFPNNRIMRTQTGTYVVEIPGLVGFGATHATAYGSDAAYCNAGVTVVPDLSLVGVTCHNASGERVDHMFTLSFTNVNEPWPGQHMAYMEVESDGAILSNRHFNSAGGLSTATRQADGYLVRIPGLASSFGHVQVTASDDGNRCKVVHWFASDADEMVLVRCWRRGSFNAQEDTPFILTYVNQQNILGLPAGAPPYGHGSAYAWADQPSSYDYTPHPFYQYTSSGYEATATGYGLGWYVMTFNGVSMDNGNVQVTAYGGGQEFCNIRYWFGSQVTVQCYDWAGTTVDALYTVAFTGS